MKHQRNLTAIEVIQRMIYFCDEYNLPSPAIDAADGQIILIWPENIYFSLPTSNRQHRFTTADHEKFLIHRFGQIPSVSGSFNIENACYAKEEQEIAGAQIA